MEERKALYCHQMTTKFVQGLHGVSGGRPNGGILQLYSANWETTTVLNNGGPMGWLVSKGLRTGCPKITDHCWGAYFSPRRVHGS